MKPGDEVWYLSAGEVNKGVYRDCGAGFHLVGLVLQHGVTQGSDYVYDKDLFQTEKEALEALIKRQTDKYAEQTQQHNDLIARLSRRLEDL